MKKQLSAISMAVLLAACGGGEESKQSQAPAEAPRVEQTQAAPATPPAPADKGALVESAKAAVQALGGTLKSELQAAMEAGGPVEALNVCNTKAPEIASKVSTEQGMQVSRTSLKNRNPDNAPADWQVAILNDFETRKTAGEDPATLSYAEIVDNEFRFMKAIPTGALCLKCHGTEISPAVTVRLGELYPADKATGFKEGDLRGAFVVVKSLAQ
ncbi:MAG: DUF3365 domain-containing protein [Gammaproteobacteria bacterium]|nr:DUF3365 domain-containing protein [Gammaproteobacteria bacterium]MBU1722562.1 DUF3365 domain-containing protein [Gammaproteobacteria bacterium]MBU2004463.1 DUF3365 domain-containing protein [Gammaproteobacteria bacterium]